MPDLAERGFFTLVETALGFVPGLLRVPTLGRIITALFGIDIGQGMDLHALERLQAMEQRRKTERRTRIERQARYVLKASDAMQCVEDNLMSSGFLLALAKGLVNVVLGTGENLSAAEILLDRIFTCIESKTLNQTNRRTRTTLRYSKRPGRGHGHGHVIPPTTEPQTAQP